MFWENSIAVILYKIERQIDYRLILVQSQVFYKQTQLDLHPVSQTREEMFQVLVRKWLPFLRDSAHTSWLNNIAKI